MTRRLWWRVEEILPLAEHAAATPQHRKTRQQIGAGWQDVPALIWSRDTGGDWLSSNGIPAWYDVDGAEHRVRAETWTHTATGAPGNPGPTDDGDGFLPLCAVHLDGRRDLLDLLRFARDHEVRWLGVNPDRTSDDRNDRYVLSPSRGDVLPPHAIWVPATVTSDTVGGGYYRALVADGHTALGGGLLCRFPRDEVYRMADHLHALSIGDMPGEHPVLLVARDYVSVRWEQDTGEDSSRWIEEDRVPADADDHYAIGAHQWHWTNAVTSEDQS
ncbi:hypothetical protein [Micromonospora globbae]|uniref:hypothetical protein n=1 Tax=Micromonospora globbae TaxID=1894969 RepID=UPI00386AEF5B|nr:hypothetical protein OH732_00370 [Micromonospora globbae]